MFTFVRIATCGIFKQSCIKKLARKTSQLYGIPAFLYIRDNNYYMIVDGYHYKIYIVKSWCTYTTHIDLALPNIDFYKK
jgi:hypothetical protein